MKVDANALNKAIPLRNKPDGTPDWLKTADNIVKGINEMVKTYTEISGKSKPPPVIEHNMENAPASFHEARAVKKAEMSGKQPALEAGVKAENMASEFKELLDGLIGTLQTYSGMGKGEQNIGEAIMELPVTVDQLKVFLFALRKKKYG